MSCMSSLNKTCLKPSFGFRQIVFVVVEPKRHLKVRVGLRCSRAPKAMLLGVILLGCSNVSHHQASLFLLTILLQEILLSPSID